MLYVSHPFSKAPALARTYIQNGRRPHPKGHLWQAHKRFAVGRRDRLDDVPCAISDAYKRDVLMRQTTRSRASNP
ncbi:hypothetical protein ElyMa_004907500 [Elysia marginata]|uniref:Uncharacterized protein n=1 Tax=Elysia marginata TaxID=1093978 RepID=A0AAV4IYE2_9GAST|nr:hypothetical protein ElyMa_004907500 [Elysia marginata]